MMSKGSITCLFSAIALIGCGGAATIAPPLAPAMPRHDSAERWDARAIPWRISKIAFHQGELWLGSVDEPLVSVDLVRRQVQRHFDDQQVLDLHRTPDDRLWVLTRESASDDVRVWQRTTKGWKPIMEFAAPVARVLGLSELGGEPLVLTERAVFWSDAGEIRSRSLSERIPLGRVPQLAIAATAAGDVYVGANTPTFNGSLRRIVLDTGRVELIRRPDGSNSCTTSNNPECDPITGVVDDPQNPDCVLASVGFSAVLAHGRLLRACGSRVSIVHGPWETEPVSTPRAVDELARRFAPPDPELRKFMNGEETLVDICRLDPGACPKLDMEREAALPLPGQVSPDLPIERVATGIIALARTRAGVWVATRNALYGHGSGTTPRIDTPSYELLGEVAIAQLPRAITVTSEIHSATALSGFTPLLASTDLASSPAPVRASPSSELPFEQCFAIERGASPAYQLCLERDRYFWRDEQGWTSAMVVWQALNDGAMRAILPDRKDVRLHFRIAPARAFLDDPGSPTMSVVLVPLKGEARAALRREIALLPSLERTCELARRCAHTAHRKAPEGPHDLRNCYFSMTKSLAELRDLPSWDSGRDAFEMADTACAPR
jgi:hypothetical protein